jgi:CheY-like chemotaxis protein
MRKLLRRTVREDIEIRTMFEPDLAMAFADPAQLESAVLNLAVNAQDAMAKGGRLTLSTSNASLDDHYQRLHPEVAPGDYVLVAVTDDGDGMPKEVIDRVFEPFFTTKEVGKGSGLGLSMVYGFVKQSAGHIKIYSEEGHGTTIKIYLPPGVGAALVSEAAIAPLIEGGHERILVVEDERLVRDYVIKQLHTLGYATLAAGNAAEGLSMVDAGTEFDLLFTDVIMPAMSGIDLAEQMLDRYPRIGVVLLSGYTAETLDLERATAQGATFVSKPVSSSQLMRAVLEAAASRRMAAERR